MKMTATNSAIMLALILVLSSNASPVESGRRGVPTVVRSERHVVHKRLTAEDVLGDMHTQESAVLNENITATQCLGNPPARGSCKELYELDDLKTSGYYRIYLGGEAEFTVFCDMSNDVDTTNRRPGYGWTVILRRLDSTTPSFNRSWQEYRNGFGCLNDSFWFGLQKIRHLVSHKLPGCTNTTHQLYVGMEHYPSNHDYYSAFYHVFSIGDESANYALNINVVGGGSSHDKILSSSTIDPLDLHGGLPFSTYDQDNDMSPGHCAEDRGGGWWYNNCLDSHLTGLFYSGGYMPPPKSDGIIWEGATSGQESLNKAVMAVRPVCND